MLELYFIGALIKEFLPLINTTLLVILVINSNFHTKEAKRKPKMNVDNDTHLLVIKYVAKLEHENAELKAELALLKKERIEDVNTDEGC